MNKRKRPKQLSPDMTQIKSPQEAYGLTGQVH